MTFMRKFLDFLNMDNWKSTDVSEIISETEIALKERSIPNNKNKAVDLYSIRSFWNSHPQTYRNDFQEASIDEYLLYGKTLMLWGFSSAAPLKSNFPVYYATECHISNPQKLQYRLLQEGYLEPASVETILSSYKIPELKVIANNIGCSKSGKKSELIERIVNRLDTDTMNAIKDSSNLYILSDKGRLFLQDNYDYVELHRHTKYGISLHEFNINRFPDNCRRTFEDNAYTLISRRIYKNCVHHYYHMMERDHRVLYEIALSEHLYDIALDSYLRSLYLQSCCTHTVQYCSSDFMHIEHNFNYHITFTEHSAQPLAELGQFYSPSFVDSIFDDFSLPPSFMSKGEFKNMVVEMIEAISFDYDKYNQLINLRLRQYSKQKN